uniref:DUF834 domain-containing protein n=1 Tax=Oryza meridionalis TaxID=40149 RepID=A0A0E0CEJ3_9ORYZ
MAAGNGALIHADNDDRRRKGGGDRRSQQIGERARDQATPDGARHRFCAHHGGGEGREARRKPIMTVGRELVARTIAGEVQATASIHGETAATEEGEGIPLGEENEKRLTVGPPGV